MDHGHMKHGGMDKGPVEHSDNMCNMNMVFTWSTHNLCIVFRQWRITGTVSLLLSLLAVVALTAGYELVREASRRYEARCTPESQYMPTSTSSADRDHGKKAAWAMHDEKKPIRAALYAVQVFYSFFIMLLFMTYNGWVMLAVTVGAFVGYMVWGSGSLTKSMACH